MTTVPAACRADSSGGHCGGSLLGFSLGASSHVAWGHRAVRREARCIVGTSALDPTLLRVSGRPVPLLGQADLAFRSQMESEDLRRCLNF